MIQPTQSYITCTIHDLEESPLHLPESSAKRLPYGKVLAVGEKVTSIIPGDRVLFMPNVPICFDKQGPDGADLFLVSEGSIVAKLTQDHAPLSTQIHAIN